MIHTEDEFEQQGPPFENNLIRNDMNSSGHGELIGIEPVSSVGIESVSTVELEPKRKAAGHGNHLKMLTLPHESIDAEGSKKDKYFSFFIYSKIDFSGAAELPQNRNEIMPQVAKTWPKSTGQDVHIMMEHISSAEDIAASPTNEFPNPNASLQENCDTDGNEK